MTSNSMMMPNSSSTSNNSQVSEVICTPSIFLPTFSGNVVRPNCSIVRSDDHLANLSSSSSALRQPGLDARQTLSSFVTQVPVCNNQNSAHQQPILKFTKAQKSVPIKSESSTQTNHLISSALNSSTLANHTITIQHQTIPNTHLHMQNGQKANATAFPSTATIMIPAANSAQLKASNQPNNQGELVWTCPSCKSPCKTATELQSHLNVHIQAAAKATTEKTVPCQQCGKMFTSQERVKIHVKVAHGQKSSQCNVCGSSFAYKCKLADHMRTHTGEKPYPCSVCGRRFSQKNHLRRHKMIHSGERPFACEVCSKGFYRKDKLSRHRLIHLNPSSRRSKQTSLNNQSTNQNNNENNSLNALNSNGSLISADLMNSNALANGNSIFQTSSSNENLLTSGTATIQLIPVQLTQQWISNINSHQNDDQLNNGSNNGVNV